MPPTTNVAPIKLMIETVSWKNRKAHRGANITSNIHIKLAVKASVQDIPKARKIPPMLIVSVP